MPIPTNSTNDLEMQLKKNGFNVASGMNADGTINLRVTNGAQNRDAIFLKLSVVTGAMGPTYVIHTKNQSFLEAPDIVLSLHDRDIVSDVMTSQQNLAARIASIFSGGYRKFGTTSQKAFENSLREEGFGYRPARILPTSANPTISESVMGAIHVTFRGEGGNAVASLAEKTYMADWLATVMGNERYQNELISNLPQTQQNEGRSSVTWGHVSQQGMVWTKGDVLQPTTRLVITINGRLKAIEATTLDRLGKSFSNAMGGTNNILIPLVKSGGRWAEMIPTPLRGSGEDTPYAIGSLTAYQASQPDVFWRQNIIMGPISNLPGGMLAFPGVNRPEKSGLRSEDVVRLSLNTLFSNQPGQAGSLIDLVKSGNLKFINMEGKTIEGGVIPTLAKYRDESGKLISIRSTKRRSPAFVVDQQVLEIPAYVNKVTGKFSHLLNNNTRLVAPEEIEALESTGLRVVTVEGIRDPRIHSIGWTTPNDAKWRDAVKAGSVISTEEQTVNIGGINVKVGGMTEEFKSGVALHRILASRSPEQLSFIFHKYASSIYGGTLGADKFADWYDANYVNVKTEPGTPRPTPDIDDLAAKLVEFRSGHGFTSRFPGASGTELVRDIFERVLMPLKAGTAANAEFLKGFGMARVDNVDENIIRWGNIHPDNINFILQARIQNEGTTPGAEERARAHMNDIYKFVAPNGSPLTLDEALNYNVNGELPKMYEKIGNSWMILGMPMTFPAEYQSKETLLQNSLAQIVAKNYPRFWGGVIRPGDESGFKRSDVALSTYMRFQSQYTGAQEIYAEQKAIYDKSLLAIAKQEQDAAENIGAGSVSSVIKGTTIVGEGQAVFYKSSGMSSRVAEPGLDPYGAVQMPKVYTEVPKELSRSIAEWLTTHNELSTTDKMAYIQKALSEIEGGIQGDILHFSTGFAPAPSAVVSLNDPVTGQPVSNLPALYVNMIRAMGAAQAAGDNPTVAEVVMGLKAQDRFFGQIHREFAAHGARYKGATSTKAVSGISGRYEVSELLGAAEMYVPPSSLRRVLREQGFSGQKLEDALAQLMSGENLQSIALRIPYMPTEQVQETTLVSFKNMAGRVSDPRRMDFLNKQEDVIYVSNWFSKRGEGDLDYDQALAILGFRRGKGNKLRIIKTGEIAKQSAQSAAESMAKILQMGLQFEQSPDKGADVLHKLINSIDWRDAQGILEESFRMSNTMKMPGAGVRYNLSRLLSAVMSAGGASDSKINRMLTTMQRIYTPGLDTWDTKNRMEQLAGRLVAAMTKGSIRRGSEGGTYIKYGSYKERVPGNVLEGFTGINIYANEIGFAWTKAKQQLRSIISLAGMPLELRKGSKHGEDYNEWMPSSLAAVFTMDEEDDRKLAVDLETQLKKGGQAAVVPVLLEHFEQYFTGLTTSAQMSAMIRKLMVTVPAFSAGLVKAEMASHIGTAEERARAKAINEEFYKTAGFTDEQVARIRAESTLTRYAQGDKLEGEIVDPNDIWEASPYIRDGLLRRSLEQNYNMQPYNGGNSNSVSEETMNKLTDAMGLTKEAPDLSALEVDKKGANRNANRIMAAAAAAEQRRMDAVRRAQFMSQSEIAKSLPYVPDRALDDLIAQVQPDRARKWVDSGKHAMQAFYSTHDEYGKIIGKLQNILGASPIGENTWADLIGMAPKEQQLQIAKSISKEELGQIKTAESEYKQAALGLAVFGRSGKPEDSIEKKALEDAMKPGAEGIASSIDLSKTISNLKSGFGSAAAPSFQLSREQSDFLKQAANIDRLAESINNAGSAAKKKSQEFKDLEKALEPFGGYEGYKQKRSQMYQEITEGKRDRVAEAEAAAVKGEISPDQLQDVLTGGGGGAGGGGNALDNIMGPEGKGRPFSMANLSRRLFSGWGLMYMKNIAEIMLGGTGFGSQEWQQQGATSAALSTTMLGQPTPFATYTQQIAAAKARIGSPSIQEYAGLYAAKHPVVQELSSSLFAGAGAFAGSEWALGMLPASVLAPEVALPIAAAIGVGTIAVNAGLQVGTMTPQAVGTWASGVNEANNKGLGQKISSFISNPFAAVKSAWYMGESIFNGFKPTPESKKTGQWEQLKIATDSLISTSGGNISSVISKMKSMGYNPSQADIVTALAGSITSQYPDIDSASASQVAAQLVLTGASINTTQIPRMAAQAAQGVDQVSGITSAMYSRGLTQEQSSRVAGRMAADTQQPLDVYGRTAVSAGEAYVNTQAAYWNPGVTSTMSTDQYNAVMRSYDISPMRQQYLTSQIGVQGALLAIGQNAPSPVVSNVPATVNQFQLTQQQAYQAAVNQYSQGILGGNAQMWGRIGTSGLNLPQYGINIPQVNLASLPAMQTAFGTSIGAQFAAFTGYNMAGQQTGGSWGQQSFQMGGVSGMTMASNIFGPSRGEISSNLGAYTMARYGSFGNGYINAMVNGQALANGQVVGGFIGAEQYAANQAYNLQMASVGVGFQQVALSQAFTTGVGIQQYAGTVNPQTGQPFGFNTGKFSFNVPGVASYTSQGGGTWGLQDAQRYLGYAQTEYGFGMQQRQLNLQTQQFAESMGLSQRGIQLGIAQGTEQYQYATGMAQQQFGFSQTMFREQARFTSGRERRLAEMQNKENVTVYNMETEQRNKEFGFQKQSWKLQEDQWNLQIKQFNQTKQLQQEQLDTTIKFYTESKKLQEQSIQLDRAQWVNQMALQKESLGIQAAQIQNAKTQNDLERVAQLYITNVQSALNALNADTFPNLLNYLYKLMGLGQMGEKGSWINQPKSEGAAMGGAIGPGDFVGEWGPEQVVRAPGGGLGVLPAGAGRGTLGQNGFATGSLGQYMGRTVLSMNGSSSRGQPINIYIGNEKIASFVIDTVNKDLRS